METRVTLVPSFCFGIGVSSSKVIPDRKMTASSQQSDLTKPSYGRLNGVRGHS